MANVYEMPEFTKDVSQSEARNSSDQVKVIYTTHVSNTCVSSLSTLAILP